MERISKMLLLLFTMQSIAFILFVMTIYSSSVVTYAPLSKKDSRTYKHIKNEIRAAYTQLDVKVDVLESNRSANGIEVVVSAPISLRGRITNCTLENIQKRPGVVLLTTVNAAFLDVTVNMLLSIRRLQLCVNTTIIAEDRVVFEFLRRKSEGDPGIHVVLTDTGEVDSRAIPRKDRHAYYGFMNKRMGYTLGLLERGWDVLFSDGDLFWFRDPFPHFQGDFDMCLRGWDYPVRLQKTVFCAGFIYLRPTNATLKFVRTWVEVMRSNRRKGRVVSDQTVMNGLLHQDQPVHVDIKPLHPNLFPWGSQFFDPSWQQENYSTVVMHAANIRGHAAKEKKFKEFGLWLVNATSDDLIASD
ncbi:UDP-D-xylose:L-fucose alpha-1,3-D-xylosyltransferase 1-like [Acanthaster planci]|uniref:UDP-D-xylose:L-fucose alpha-1,3-D-xylosyltransferase 1-like n=1 Tax=Acanthaster planci TaxID=133434 RepID=A0A8B7XLU7_ACAPL|nr:UDP-D-xylose:L-fucose alpha-1,3-D-xylosyltransferase 1-like [Acanthaster planci]